MTKSNFIYCLVIFIAILFGNISALLAEQTILLEVSAGKTTRNNSVISFALPQQLKDKTRLNLFRVDDGQKIAMQIDQSRKQWELVWVLQKPLLKGTTRKYRLVQNERKASDKFRTRLRVEVTDDKKQINIKADGKPVLSYRHAIVKAPDRKQNYYDKSGYIHPLYTPSGKIITDDFNPNHAHQHGIMFSWRKILFEGRENNGWDQKSKLGKVTHHKIEKMTSGTVFGSFITIIDHVDLTKKEGPVTMLKETWDVRVFAMEDQFLFDIKSIQRCATDKPVTIKKMHYGGMTIRGHADWHEHHNFNYLTSEGKDKKDGNHSRPQWVEMYGPLKGETAGVAILCHPKNFRYPQPVRLHPTMPYFCFAVSALDTFQIEPDKPYVSRYRYFVHDSKPNAKTNQQLWEDYAAPIEVKIISKK